ncbi:MAG: TatD family hydrolase [Bryobacteraceae bacterium]|nr:TatD family hydrolase [Bryobacteraceae bacterium]
MSLIDSHCHLDDEQFDGDREAVLERAWAAGVSDLLAIGTGDGPPDLECGIRLAERYPSVHATVGVHPHTASKADPAAFRRLEELLAHPKVVALGEIGLDYHYDFSPRETQRAVFIEQLGMAAAARKPVIIHTREAWDDTMALLERHWRPAASAGIMHCFSGGPQQAEQAVAMGFYISFAGIVTFPKALGVQAAARQIPLDRLLVETDAPYLAPAPHRGKRNEPAFVVHTARKVAELRGAAAKEIERAATDNFRRLCLQAKDSSGYT